MKINLKNIRQHADYTVELPNKGLVLLKGNSGCGKTSILDSIKFGLFDADDMLSWDKKTASVTIDWLGRTIVKTIGPESLSISTGEHDAAAQSQIVNLLGMGEEEFCASSYITQDGAESLLNLKPTAQLQFIQRLVSGNLDIVKIREKARFLINQQVSNVEKLKEYQAKVDADVSRLTTELSGISGELGEAVPPVDEDEMKKALISVKSRNDQKEALQKHKAALYELLNHPAHKFRAEYDATKMSLIDQMIKIQAEIDELGIVVGSSCPWTGKSKSDVNCDRQKIVTKRNFLSFKEDFFKFKKDVIAKFPQMEGHKLISALQEKKLFLENERLSLVGQIGECQSELGAIRVAKASMSCPSCSAPLKFDGKKLICCSDNESVDVDREPAIVEKIKELTDLQRKKAEDIRAAELLLNKGEQLMAAKEKFSGLPTDISVADLDAEQAELDQYVATQNKIEAGIAIRNKDLENKRRDLASCQTTLNTINDRAKEYSKIKKFEELKLEVDGLETEIEKVWQQIRSDYDVIDDLKARQHDHEVYKMRLASFTKTKGELESKKCEVALSQLDMMAVECGLAAAHKVQNIVSKAAVESLSDIIESLNSNAAYYINKLFPEGETSVIIRNSRQLKSGDEKPELSIVITHKGSKVKKLSSLSGGEKARLTLSFQLALSDLYKSPILLVDEACSGLDEETKEKCFGILKEASDSKLVICVEHGAPDHVFCQIVEV